MKTIYAKTILYAYPSFNSLAKQIDELVERRALSSMTDFSSCEKQCEKIIDLTQCKDLIFSLKLNVEEVLKKFTKEEIEYFDYKFFRLKPRDYNWCFEPSSRAYFRKQIKLSELFAKRLDRVGVNDEFFEKNCLEIEFFKELLKRTAEHEIISKKNKPKKKLVFLMEKSA